MHLNDNLVRSYYNTLKALGFEHGGNGITLDNFNNHFCLVFKLTADYHIEDNTIRPELTGAAGSRAEVLQSNNKTNSSHFDGREEVHRSH